MISEEQQREIIDSIHALERCWSDHDLMRIRTLWEELPAPLYLPEEAATALTTWESLEAYWRSTAEALPRVAVRSWDYRFHALADDLVSVIYQMHWDARLADGKCMGGDNRVCATLRRHRSGWRFVQYIEAPLAPISYVRLLYERSVTAGFA
ncbi:MAG: nuclear transport factor 2 family protein [Steroidobacteraceae bacterium]|nr:nuclear transport factor 2 family protein [Steroidobacteraceae bacterium]MDW8260658.1 nuclear transport factor 2 family protein [Gammaproteobacteria bacterium]